MRICFYPAQSGKVWDGGTLEREALGGSETAVIYIARALAARGHEVLVFTKGTPGVYNDVTYLPFERARNILRTLPLDVLICSRDPLPLVWNHQARLTFLWLHDLPSANVPAAHGYVCVSQWQAGVYIGANITPKERTLVIPNGVDIALFGPAPKRSDFEDFDEHSPITFAWTSNPERGLWRMGEVLQRVRQQYPQACLRVVGRNAVYGWDASCEGNFLPTDRTNVFVHEAKRKEDLAQFLRACDLWVYPTWWPETYSIAAVEAQAAGLPLVVSNYGALGETVRGGLLVPGKAGDEGHIEAIHEAVLSLLQNPDQRFMLARRGRAFAETQTWTAAAALWEQSILHGLGLAA